MSSTFDGRCVKIIVFTSPMRRASQPAASAETPGQEVGEQEDRAEHRRVEAEPDVEPVGDEALDDEPAAEGVEGEEERQLEDHPPGLVQPQHAPWEAGGTRPSSPRPPRTRTRTRRSGPRRCQRRPARPGGRRRLRSGRSAVTLPQSARPPAHPGRSRTSRRGCTRRTRPSAARRRRRATSAACSTDRNGPISFPLGLMTPTVAATTSRRKLPVETKTTPARAIRTAPRISVRRRPSRSAVVVSQREIAVSPASVSVSRRPTSHSLRPTSTRYRTSTTESSP